MAATCKGVGTATLVYFRKTPAQLTLAEALTLVVIPQAPRNRAPRTGAEPESLKAARARLFARWLALHPNASDQAGFMDLGLQYRASSALPFEAPHFVNAMLARRAGAPIIRTTLDLQRQRIVERVLQNFVHEHERVGIRNAAALLVDCRDMRVVASVGSARFFDDSIAGQVNGTLAKRSPGSALKPFIYALAMDQGLIHPLTVLEGCPGLLRHVQPGELRRPIRGALERNRSSREVAQHSRHCAECTPRAAEPLPVPAQRRHLAHGQRAALRPGARAGRW